MADIAVRVDGIGKRYRISHQGEAYGRLTESLSSAFRAPFDRVQGKQRETSEWFWALQDVSFEIERGDVIGIVGRNGAGKSTLLKILSRITEPTAGVADLDGRVASLLEVGTGFHPELSGRENIYLSGSILGMRREETRRRFDEIVEFAEVEQFLDTPVKRYSSGMSVRLGFAVAAHLETEILIVDEVLAVGDAAFQKRCMAKMGDVSGQGRTILFVSHNMPAVEALCDLGILLDNGIVVSRGTATGVVNEYLQRTAELASSTLRDRTDRNGDGRLRFTGVQSSLRTGSDGEIVLAYEGGRDLRNVEVSIGLFNSRGEGGAHFGTTSVGESFATLPDDGELVCRIPRMPLMPGPYVMNIYCTVAGTVADWVTEAATLTVDAGDYYGTGKLPPAGYGSVMISHQWRAGQR